MSTDLNLGNVLRPLPGKDGWGKKRLPVMTIQYDGTGWVEASVRMPDSRHDGTTIRVVEDSVARAVEMLAHRVDLYRQAIEPQDDAQ